MKQPTAKPTRKMSAVGVSGVLTGVIIWAGNQFFGVEVSPDIASGLVVAVSWIVGYMVPERDS